jgi:hypothetical protein
MGKHEWMIFEKVKVQKKFIRTIIYVLLKIEKKWWERNKIKTSKNKHQIKEYEKKCEQVYIKTELEVNM